MALTGCVMASMVSTLDRNNQLLKSGQNSQTLFLHSCTGSPSYRKAVEDIKLVFPEGVCCTETSVMRHEKVS